MFGTDFAQGLVETTNNPFVGLFVGMLATALIQSSSTTTTFIVSLVASGALGSSADPDTISRAIPMIMGANVGTTVTSTIVSLGHIMSRNEYRKALATAAVHNFFNILAVLVLFPLELLFGVLSKPATALAVELKGESEGGGIFSLLEYTIKPVATAISDLFDLFLPTEAVPWVTLPLALIMLFLAIRSLVLMLRRYLIGPVQKRVETVLFGRDWAALGWGTLITGIFQSSSATTSLTVPLVATGKVPLQKAFPFIMGANIGTTATALIAALVTTDGNMVAGLAIAFSHVLFNLYGVILMFPIPAIRKIPVMLARSLGQITLKNRLIGIAYFLVVFFLIPFILIVMTRGMNP